MTIIGIDHVQVAAPPGCEDEARAFYGGLLGLEELPKPEALAARGGCWFRAGAQELHVGVEEPFAPARKAHPGLVVDDLDALARAAARGGARSHVRRRESAGAIALFTCTTRSGTGSSSVSSDGYKLSLWTRGSLRRSARWSSAKSFSQAAERLGVTQPAVSLQVRALEKRLGTQLLDRSGRRVEPTEAGAAALSRRAAAARARGAGRRRARRRGERRAHRDARDRRLDRPRRCRPLARSSASSRRSIPQLHVALCGLRHADDRRARRRPEPRARRRRRRAAPPRRRVRAVLPRHGRPRLPAGTSVRRPDGDARRAAAGDR